MRKKIVQEEVQLRDHAHVFSGTLVNWDNSLHPNLKVFTRPNDPGIYRADCLSLRATVQRTFKCELDQRNQSIKWRVQVHVLYLRLQVDHAVLQCESPLQHVWVPLDLNVAVAGLGIHGDTSCGRAGGNCDAKLSCKGERLEEAQLTG